MQTIEDSPHRKGTAYIAIYRYLREHDLKPYIYKTDDYGESWTLLTDGTNGIPADHPTRVVREDPAREGLLYAGTEFSAFVSFNGGRHWQTLAQNLPATPVTDMRVHRNDLVVSTMGRSLWIMDNVTPLQQLAALAAGSSPTSSQGARPDAAGVTLAIAPGAVARQASQAAPAAVGRATLPSVHLFQPRDTIRYRHSANAGGNGEPEYPAPGVHVDLWFASAPPADTRLEVLDAKGQVVRAIGLARAAAGGTGQEMRGPGRGQAAPAAIRADAGMQRVNWDMRHPGPWTSAAPGGGGGGPMAAPGKYTARLTAGGQAQTRDFDLMVDPRVTRDGVTQADLETQATFLLSVRDAISDARKLQQQVEESMKKAGVAPVPAAQPGVTAADATLSHPLQRLWARLVEQPGIYPQPMLINQLQNVARMVGQADQKVGRDAVDRLADLTKELKAVQAEFQKVSAM